MSKKLIALLFLGILLSSCLDEDRGTLKFIDKTQQDIGEPTVDSTNPRLVQELEEELWRQKLINEKKEDWAKIVIDAKQSYQSISNIVEKKCLDCHDSLNRLPFYGRIFPSRNPVTKHQVEGLKALDFAEVFPLKAQGNPTQLSLLKAIKASVVDKTMPIKSYVLVYPFRRLKKKDQVALLGWLNPLIEEIESFNEKYSSLDGQLTTEQKVTRLFRNKCFRCHANGNTRGGFGDMENNEKLFNNPKGINKEEPQKSPIYTLSVSGRMPTDPRERLSEEELSLMLDWIVEKTQ